MDSPHYGLRRHHGRVLLHLPDIRCHSHALRLHRWTPGDCTIDESSTRLSSGHPIKVDGVSTSVVVTRATMTGDCSTVCVGSSGVPVIGAMETPVSPPIIAAEDGLDDQAAMLFLGASTRGSRRRLALQGA